MRDIVKQYEKEIQAGFNRKQTKKGVEQLFFKVRFA